MRAFIALQILLAFSQPDIIRGFKDIPNIINNIRAVNDVMKLYHSFSTIEFEAEVAPVINQALRHMRKSPYYGITSKYNSSSTSEFQQVGFHLTIKFITMIFRVSKCPHMHCVMP